MEKFVKKSVAMYGVKMTKYSMDDALRFFKILKNISVNIIMICAIYRDKYK